MPSATAESLEFQHARVLDGTGRPAYDAHVLVDDGVIQRVGDDPAGADRVIDLDGSYLAPGFIDMHAHSELRLFHTPGAPEQLTQGITTVVLGQDGVSVAPIPEWLREEWAARIKALDGEIEQPWEWQTVGAYLDALADARPAINAAFYAPHGNLRSLVAGFDDRELTRGELGTIEAELGKCIEAGAFGLSTGMIYPPSSYGRDDELEGLAETLSAYSSFMVSHVWNETDRVVPSIERFLELCRRGGCHAHVSHLKVGGQDNWGASEAVLDLFDDAEAAGQRVSFDQYPYTAGSTMLTALLPPWARQGDSAAIQERLRGEEIVDRLSADLESAGEWENLARAAGDWGNILITRTKSGDHEGRTIAEIAGDRAAADGTEPISGGTIGDTGAVGTLRDILLEEDLDVTMADFIMDEGDIERFLADERGTFCTDGIFGGKPHPRAIATFARLLERYVAERDVLSPETFAYKAAGHPADILGLPDRGYVEAGNVADLVAFDLERVSANATYEDPLQLSNGFEYVMVGGEIAVRDGDPTEVRNGHVLHSTEQWDGSVRPTLDRQAGIDTAGD